MKRLTSIALIFSLAILLSTRILGQMTGTYTVDPLSTGGFAAKEFTSVKAAVDSLLLQGISGAVIINIADGEYTEQINMSHAITGSSAANTITFQSESGDSSKVIIKWNSTSSALNYVWLSTDPDYIIFRDLTFQALNSTYGILINIDGTSTNILVEHCRFIGYPTTAGYSDEHVLIRSFNDPTDKITIQNNFFQNCTVGVHFRGVNSSTLSPGLRILNNVFAGQREAAVYLQYQNAPVVNGNNINNGSDPSYGVYMYYCDNKLEIQNNKINLPTGYWGIFLEYCDATTLQEGLVVNNFVTLQGGDDASGIRLHNSNYHFIYHNSVLLTSTVNDYDWGCFHLYLGSNIKVRNNIFAHFGGYYAYNIRTASAVVESDNNIYFAIGNSLGEWNDVPVADLATLQAANLTDGNSVSVNPAFFSAIDLHTKSSFVDGHGANVGVTTDIDGKTRTDYDIGASEFTAPWGQALSGTYTVGGTSPDFATLTAAIDSVCKLGVSSSVIFNIRSGSYTGQYIIYPVPGAGPGKTVTFQAESGDSTDVELSNNSGSTNNYVLKLYGADYITIKKLTLSSLSTTYAVVIDLVGNVTNDSISNCVINGDKTASNNNALIDTWERAISTNLVIYNNIISGGRIGILLSMNNQGLAKGTVIKNNIISGQAGSSDPYGIYIRDHEAPVVTDNIVTNTTDIYFYGIHLEECTDELQVLRNKVSLSNSNCGIRLYRSVGTSAKRGLVANNFVVVGGTSYAYCIWTYDCDYQNIFNNSLRINSTSTTDGVAFLTTNGSTNIVLKNNILANFGGGWALYSASATDISASDYNDLYITGKFIAYWNGVNKTSLADYQSASTFDAHSVNANPAFVSANDMHTTSSFLDSAGTAVAEVTTDIDGEARNATYPDIGADEFTAVSLPLAGTYTIGGSSPDYADFSDAAAALNQLGISAPVTFNVRAGTYNDQFSLSDINGADAVNTITFQSETGDSTSVELTFSSSQTFNYLAELVGTDYITFRNMTFSVQNASYSVIFRLAGGIDGLTIKNCVMNGLGGYSSEYDRSIIYSGSSILSNVTIENNIFSGGRSGVWIACDPSYYSSGVKILNNQFSGNYYEAIYLRYHSAPEVSGNRIERTDNTGYYAILLHNCSNNLLITKNQIKCSSRDGAIRLYYCIGTTGSRGLVANNFVDVGGTDWAIGILTDYSDYQRIYSNSVRITSTMLIADGHFITGMDPT